MAHLALGFRVYRVQHHFPGLGEELVGRMWLGVLSAWLWELRCAHRRLQLPAHDKPKS